MKVDVCLMRRIHHRLKRRHKATGDKGLLAVGLGWARKDGQPDPARRQAVIYLVKKKKDEKRVPQRQRIKSQVAVYLTGGRGRNKRRRRLVLPTDVIAIGPKTVLNCLKAAPSIGTEFFTVGALVSWGPASQPLAWGVLTVGHGLPAGVGGAVSVTLDGGLTASGKVVAATSGADALDAALIQFGPDVTPEILKQYLLPPAGSAPPPVPPTDELQEEAIEKSDGVSCTASSRLPMQLLAFFPRQTIIEGGANLHDVVMAEGSDFTFQPGTSGSVWLVGSAAVAVQVAGSATTDLNGVAHQWIYGFGQPMSEYLDWARNQSAVGGQPFNLVCIL